MTKLFNTKEGEEFKGINSDLSKAEISQKERAKLAEKGKAMPDGSYPIRNREDLKNAIQAFGRAKNKIATKRFIKKRAKELNAESLLPEHWLTKARKGDANYAEWLRKYREKRGKKVQDHESGEKAKSLLESKGDNSKDEVKAHHMETIHVLDDLLKKEEYGAFNETIFQIYQGDDEVQKKIAGMYEKKAEELDPDIKDIISSGSDRNKAQRLIKQIDSFKSSDLDNSSENSVTETFSKLEATGDAKKFTPGDTLKKYGKGNLEGLQIEHAPSNEFLESFEDPEAASSALSRLSPSSPDSFSTNYLFRGNLTKESIEDEINIPLNWDDPDTIDRGSFYVDKLIPLKLKSGDEVTAVQGSWNI